MLKTAAVALGFALAALIGSASARTPVVVELFTSQGCASCVGSGDLVGDLAARPNVLALTFSVDYWDYLGWADTFAKPEFADRQRAYLKWLAVRGGGVTPQVVVDGRLQAPAVRRERVEALVKQAARLPRDPPDLIMRKTKVVVGSGDGGQDGADVWLIRYDPSLQSVAVKRGDNRGQTIVERNVVRELVRLGAWRGHSKAYRLPKPTAEGLKTVIIVQSHHTGRILTAREA
jgi:hypothetical protein